MRWRRKVSTLVLVLLCAVLVLESAGYRLTLLSISTSSSQHGQLSQESEQYGELKANLLTAISFHNKQIFCRACNVNCVLVRSSSASAEKPSSDAVSRRFLKIDHLRGLLAKGNASTAVVLMDVDTIFTMTNCSLFDDLLPSTASPPTVEQSHSVAFHEVPNASLRCLEDLTALKDDGYVGWSIAMAPDKQSQTKHPELQSGVIIVRNDCRSKWLIEYMRLLGSKKTNTGAQRCIHVPRNMLRLVQPVAATEDAASAEAEICPMDVLKAIKKWRGDKDNAHFIRYRPDFNFKDFLVDKDNTNRVSVAAEFQSDQQAINLLLDVIQSMEQRMVHTPVRNSNKHHIRKLCVLYAALCPLIINMLWQPGSDGAMLRVLPREVYNSFPHMDTDIWSALRYEQGDEVINSSAIVHFAGVYGGADIETGKLDVTIALLSVCEFLNRHVRFLTHVLVNTVAGLTRQSIARFQDIESMLKDCVTKVFSSFDETMATTMALSCLKQAMQHLNKAVIG